MEHVDEQETIFDTHKDLLFLTNPLAKLQCRKIFGDDVYIHARLRSRAVTEGKIEAWVLKRDNFGLLDAQGDDGSLTRWMMRQGFSLPRSNNTLELPSPSFFSTPLTTQQIEVWLTEDPSLVKDVVHWEEHYEDHGLTCVVPFPSYIEELCNKHKVVDLKGRSLSGQERQKINEMLLNAQAQWEKGVIKEGMGSAGYHQPSCNKQSCNSKGRKM